MTPPYFSWLYARNRGAGLIAADYSAFACASNRTRAIAHQSAFLTSGRRCEAAALRPPDTSQIRRPR